MSFSIYPPLEDKALHTQSIFRKLLSAASLPGTIVSVGEVSPWGQMDGASTAIIQTLCDHHTSIYFSPSLHDAAIIESTSFHTGARLCSAQTASFVFASSEDSVAFNELDHGDEYTPERAATLVMQIHAWAGGTPLTLTGPGIKDSKTISPVLSQALLSYLTSTDKADYPCGIDIYLTNGHELMALPRTTHMMMEKN